MTRPAIALAFSVLLVLAQSSAAAPPATLSYQGVLTDGNGVVVPSSSYGLRFQVFASSSGGQTLFTQDLDVEVTDGLYNVILSTTTPGVIPGDLSLAFDDVNQGRYMQVTILSSTNASMASAITAAGGQIVLGPRHEIASVPYALSAANLSVEPTSTIVARPILLLSSRTTQSGWGDAGSNGNPATWEQVNGFTLTVEMPANSGSYLLQVFAYLTFRHDNNDSIHFALMRKIDGGPESAKASARTGSSGRAEFQFVEVVNGDGSPHSHVFLVRGRQVFGEASSLIVNPNTLDSQWLMQTESLLYAVVTRLPD